MICKNCKSRMKKDNLMKAYINFKTKRLCATGVYRCKNCNYSLITFKNEMWLDENDEEVKL